MITEFSHPRGEYLEKKSPKYCVYCMVEKLLRLTEFIIIARTAYNSEYHLLKRIVAIV